MTVPIPSPVETLAARARGRRFPCRGGIGIGVGERLRRPIGPVLSGRDWSRQVGGRRGLGRRDRRPVERAAALGVTGEQLLQPAPQFRVSGARLVEERGSFGRIGPVQGFGEEVEFVHGRLR